MKNKTGFNIGLINKIKNIGLDIELTNKIKEITSGLSNDIFMDLGQDLALDIILTKMGGIDFPKDLMIKILIFSVIKAGFAINEKYKIKQKEIKDINDIEELFREISDDNDIIEIIKEFADKVKSINQSKKYKSDIIDIISILLKLTNENDLKKLSSDGNKILEKLEYLDKILSENKEDFEDKLYTVFSKYDNNELILEKREKISKFLITICEAENEYDVIEIISTNYKRID